MKILFDLTLNGERYLSTRDMLEEAKLLGLTPQSTVNDLHRELNRRGLLTYHLGSVIASATA